MPRAAIFADGILPDLNAARKVLQTDDFCIAADGGARHILALGRSPNVLIGDMDSIPPAVQASLRKSRTRVIVHPTEKDANDLELALDFALGEGYCEIVIFAALGGRLDHTVANLALLARPVRSGCGIRIDDGREEAAVAIDCVVFSGAAGDTVSLLPWGCEAKGVRTNGLAYPLMDETLYPDRTRGVSNRMTDRTAEICLREGKLLCIHTRKE